MKNLQETLRFFETILKFDRNLRENLETFGDLHL